MLPDLTEVPDDRLSVPLGFGGSPLVQQPKECLEICGHGGGQWQVIVRGDEIVGVETGLHEDRLATCRLNVETFASLAQGRTSWDDAFQSGAAEIRGNGRTLDQYSKLLEQMLAQTVN